MIKFYLLFFIGSLFFCSSTYCAVEGSKLEKAKVLIAEKKLNEAFSLLILAQQEEPNNTTIEKTIANLQYERHASADAATRLEALQTKGLGDELTALHLLEMLELSNQYSKAINLIDQIKPNNFSIENKMKYYTAAGKVYDKADYYPQSKALWQEAIKLEPNNIQVIERLAKVNDKLTLFEESLEWYKKYLAIEKTSYSKWFQASLVAQDAQQPRLAVEYLQESKKAGHPDNMAWNYELAGIYYDTRDFGNAKQYLLKSQQLSPYDQDVANMLAYTHYYMGEQDAARNVIDKMLKINPNNADLVYLIGMTYQREKNYNKAEYFFEKAIKMKPTLEKLRETKMNY